MASQLEFKRNNMLKERIVDIEFQINRLGIQGRAYYEASQIKLRRNRMLIRSARTTNMLLHSAWQLLQQKERASRKESADLEGTRKRAKTLREKFDEERGKAIALQLGLHKQLSNTRDAELLCADVLDPNTPALERIRLYEARLVAIFEKIKETRIVETKYEDLLKPMREEHVIFASQLESLKNVIDAKTDQLMQLRMVVFDGNKSRLQAKKELEEIVTTWFAGKRFLISQGLQQKMIKNIRKIQSRLDVDSMRVMFSQYLFQQKQVKYLEAVKKELQTSLAQLKPSGEKRKASLPINEVNSLIDSTKENVRKLAEFKPRKHSYPLELIVAGTRDLVEKLQTGSTYMATKGLMPQVENLLDAENRLIQLLTQLNRQIELLKERHEELEREKKAKAKVEKRAQEAEEAETSGEEAETSGEEAETAPVDDS